MAAQFSSTPQMATDVNEVVVSKIWWAGLVALIAAVVANLLVRALLFALIDLPGSFPPLQFGPIALFTAIGVGLGAVVFAIVSRLARRPIRMFSIIAFVALIASLVPNVLLMANPSSAPFPGGSALAFGVLIVFHVVAALVSVPLLISLCRR